MPELAVNPSDAGDEAVRFDRAKDRACLRIDLMGLAVTILPDPERSFRPREPGVTTGAWRRDGAEHAAGPQFDLLNAIFGELVQVLAIEGRASMRGNVDCAHGLPAGRIE